jgi:hypothetical protein
MRLWDHTHSDTPHSVGLLWTRDRPVTEASTWQHNIHKRQTSIPTARFEPAIPASERPQTYALDSAAIGIGSLLYSISIYHHSRCTSTNYGGQKVVLFRGFSVYLIELSGCCMECTIYFWKRVCFLRNCLYVSVWWRWPKYGHRTKLPKRRIY